MKAEELCIGDWVEFPHGIDRIVDLPYIRGNGLCASFDASEALFSMPIELLKPIPLTPEILEKNGWVHYEDDKDSFHGEDCVFLKQKEGGYGVCIDKVRTISGMIYYVHELQNALHFCEIEKEIEL